MRRLNIFIVIILLAAAGFSQNTVDTKTVTDGKTGAVDTKTTTDTKTEGANGTEKKESDIQKLPVGYGDLAWGMYLSDARPKIAGVLVYTDEKKIIVSKDGDLEYRYGFFYIDPTVVEDEVPVTGTEVKTEGTETVTTDTTAAVTEEKKDEGKLFYVSLNFPYLDKDSVYNKIKKKYGVHSGDNIRDNQGAIAWNSDDTIIIMWVDKYKKKPYCRRVVYISKKISKELNDYTYKIFNKKEMDLIKKFNP
ncbi:MAG TPA: hypothetical protein PK514_00490 [Spirochaetota bacterium]|nr:hypothetical protein [Spirochaetota bacterium]